MSEIIVSDETGTETAEEIRDHLEEWHNYNFEHQWPEDHLFMVHMKDHEDGGTFEYHVHPIG